MLKIKLEQSEGATNEACAVVSLQIYVLFTARTGSQGLIRTSRQRAEQAFRHLLLLHTRAEAAGGAGPRRHPGWRRWRRREQQ